MTVPSHVRRAILVTLAVQAIAAREAPAQVTLTPYAASNEALPTSPEVYGLGITSWSGIFGIRASGAVGDLRTRHYADGTSRTRPGAWTADADLVLSPSHLREWRALFGGIAPAGFVGFGTQGMRTVDGVRSSAPTWSWGGSLGFGIAGPLAIETEARWRHPIATYEKPIPEGFHDDWEYRVGLALTFGGRRGGGDDDWPSSGRGRSSRETVRLPGSHPTSVPAPTTTRTSASAARVLDTADDYLGTRYVYGGESPSGFDCSGFVQYVYRRHGLSLPRTSREQAYAGDAVMASLPALRAGDLLFFSTHGGRVDHVAIYAGGRRMIHSSSSGSGVRYDDLTSDRGRWFVEHMVAARRVLDGSGRSLVDGFTLPRGLRVELDPPDLAPRP